MLKKITNYFFPTAQPTLPNSTPTIIDPKTIPPSTPLILNLPDDSLTDIFSFLTIKEKLNVAKVNKRFSILASKNILWLSLIEKLLSADPTLHIKLNLNEFSAKKYFQRSFFIPIPRMPYEDVNCGEWFLILRDYLLNILALNNEVQLNDLLFSVKALPLLLKSTIFAVNNKIDRKVKNGGFAEQNAACARQKLKAFIKEAGQNTLIQLSLKDPQSLMRNLASHGSSHHGIYSQSNDSIIHNIVSEYSTDKLINVDIFGKLRPEVYDKLFSFLTEQSRRPLVWAALEHAKCALANKNFDLYLYLLENVITKDYSADTLPLLIQSDCPNEKFLEILAVIETDKKVEKLFDCASLVRSTNSYLMMIINDMKYSFTKMITDYFIFIASYRNKKPTFAEFENLVVALLVAGQDINEKNNSSIQIAITHNDLNVVIALIRYGAKVTPEMMSLTNNENMRFILNQHLQLQYILTLPKENTPLNNNNNNQTNFNLFQPAPPPISTTTNTLKREF